MKVEEIERKIELYKSTLLDNVIPFWESKSLDLENGGYFTCLTREGEVFDTDKFMWLQGRQAWTFAMLYEKVAPKQEWMNVSKVGIEFLRDFGRDKFGYFYFSMTKEGKPLVMPYNIFSDCFAALAFNQYGKITEDQSYLNLASDTFKQIIDRQQNPKGYFEKSFPGTRPMKSFALPMILSNLALELESSLEPALVERIIQESIDTVIGDFLDSESLLIYENRNLDGSFSDTFDGRLLNPGHGIEAMWFMMDIARRKNDMKLAAKAKDVTLSILEYSWDTEYGGIYYFLDSKGYPPQQLEWDQKLWWVHIETLIALIKGYELTGDEACLTWFEKVHDYTWSHFADPNYPEWFGYLNRAGEVSLNLKGGKWKGCFHVPRGLFQVWQTLERIKLKSTAKKG